MQRWRSASVVLAVMVLAGSVRVGAQEHVIGSASSQLDAIEAREELVRIVDDTLAVGIEFGLGDEITARLEEARALVEDASPDELAGYAQIAPQVRKLHEILAETRRILRSAPPPPPPATDSTGFPVAEDPNYNWNFFIPSQSASLDDAGGASDTSSDAQSDSDNCSFANRKTVQEMFALLNGTAVAEVVQQVASRICDQVIVVLGGGNASIVCVITDIVYDVVKAIQDNIFLCEDTLDGAEASASYLRLEHLHTDLEGAEQSLTQSIDASTTTVTTSVTNAQLSIEQAVDEAEANLNQVVETNTDEVLAAVDEVKNDILTVVQAGQDYTLRIEIEKALRDDKRLAVFFLPQAQGGQGELVRQIVVETLDRVLASGEGINAASAKLAAADQAWAQGKYKLAFHHFARTYFEAVKILGDTQ